MKRNYVLTLILVPTVSFVVYKAFKYYYTPKSKIHSNFKENEKIKVENTIKELCVLIENKPTVENLQKIANSSAFSRLLVCLKLMYFRKKYMNIMGSIFYQI